MVDDLQSIHEVRHGVGCRFVLVGWVPRKTGRRADSCPEHHAHGLSVCDLMGVHALQTSRKMGSLSLQSVGWVGKNFFRSWPFSYVVSLCDTTAGKEKLSVYFWDAVQQVMHEGRIEVQALVALRPPDRKAAGVGHSGIRHGWCQLVRNGVYIWTHSEIGHSSRKYRFPLSLSAKGPEISLEILCSGGTTC
jgi:hypothetical protein